MKKLEKLTQNKFGTLSLANGEEIRNEYIFVCDKIKTLVIEHPCLEISNVINEMANRNSLFIPKNANAYITSDFSANTQHLKKDNLGNEKFYSVFAIQFYNIFNLTL